MFGFDRRVRLEFHGPKISSDSGLLLFRELGEVLGLPDIAGRFMRDTRTGHNRLQSLIGLLRQSVFGRLAGYLTDQGLNTCINKCPIISPLSDLQTPEPQSHLTSETNRNLNAL